MTQAPTRILVVDDDATACLLFRAALTIFGFEVSLAGTGDDALHQFRAAPFDMVLLDIDLPGMSGHEVCRALRAEADPLLPILMVTGMDDVQSVEKAYSSGANDFIVKPMNWSLIGHRVKYLLRGHQTALALRAANSRNAAVLNAIPDLLFELDLDGRYISFHSPRTDRLAAPETELVGKLVTEVLPLAAAQVCMLAIRIALVNGLSSGMQFELQLGAVAHWFELSVSRKDPAPGEQAHFIVLSRDITERRDAEKKILQLAYSDILTGLPNRQSFIERLHREIRRARQGDLKLAVLFMDLDGFKKINDTMGHRAGDQALQWAADRLRELVRSADLVSRMTGAQAPVAPEVEIARLGGDEFTAMIPGIKRPEDALAISQRILQLMRQPFVLNNQEVTLSVSIGIALYPGDGLDGASLLKHADSALYLAKDMGRDNCQFYSPSLTEIAVRRMALEGDLRLGLERSEFCLVYQPQVDVASGRVDSVEALIRWNHPVRGKVAPLEFITAAEESGLIVPIGQWVLQTACTDAAAWQREGHSLRVAVNLSALQFKDARLVQSVLDTLAQTGLAPNLLELEVTESVVMESVVMEDTAATMATLNAFRRCGVRIALDDFGTGYSSLSYLKRMPISKLKVDQSFVMGLPEDAESHAIVRAILAMADSLDMSVTAEGVETLEQARVLQGLACGSLQGYFFSHPVPAAAILPLLKQCGLNADTWSACLGVGPRSPTVNPVVLSP